VVEALRKRPEAWIDFMMRFELGSRSRIPGGLTSALTIAGHTSPAASSPGALSRPPDRADGPFPLGGRHLVALTLFGYVKGHFTGASPVRSALQTASSAGSPPRRPSASPVPSARGRRCALPGRAAD